ncbi:uncharacterized protein LOC106139600 isoform X1 [Amyelois transitella]|uniref:uncharacterized protein LOC106139600 isoform X1 n=1 Tax=Amyelois transitella TaxID=680683 RepID=UPI002990585F|nr:uncharacterized protein LOC106139600 isoform X1 [Amyelois transitella]
MMAARSRFQNNSNEWDSMREEFNNSTYDAQYPDEETSGGVQLDHCRLYITNVPPVLNEEGLRAAFSKYGTLTEVHVSKDPTKKYALVRFETPGEAKLAMTKLNRTEPLRLNINIAHKTKAKHQENRNADRDREHGGRKSAKADTASVGSRGRTRKNIDLSNGDNDMEDEIGGNEFELAPMDPDLELELEQIKLKQLELQEEQVRCKQRLLLLKTSKRASNLNSSINRCILPDGRIVVRNISERNLESRDGDTSFGAGAGDSNERDTLCSCKTKLKSWDEASEGSSTPSTCVLCSEDSQKDQTYKETADKSKSRLSKYTSKKSEYSTNFAESKATVTSVKSIDVCKRSNYTSKFADTVSKQSECTNKKFEDNKLVGNRSEVTYDMLYGDFYSDDNEEVDETNRLIQLRNSDYMDIVEDALKIVIALAGYPKAKMRLRQMEMFQRCLTDVIDMQLKAGLLKKVPVFLDYYLNRGAIVCVCKDVDTRNWMVRVNPGLQERMCTNLILLKAKVKRLCLGILKIPMSCWPATARDAFKLLQYFNPTLKTNLWKIYSQKLSENVETTSFLIDRVSGEIIRGPNFKNVIDYGQMDFELTGYTEIYYECLLSDIDEDLSSVASRVKLLEEIKSAENTPRMLSDASLKDKESQVFEKEQKCIEIVEKQDDEPEEYGEEPVVDLPDDDVKHELESSLQKDVLKKLKDVKYIGDRNEVIVWSDETNVYNSDQEYEKDKIEESSTNIEEVNDVSHCAAVSDKTESFIESNDNLISRNSNLNIDSNRGIAYHRRTNYLHVENDLKVAITLEGYPQNKLEGTHIRRLKHLFKEYLHKDMKQQRFTDLIIPKFQDVYLSNGAVIYVCDSLETKDYLTEVLPRFIHSTGLKLTFRDIRNLVRYTRIVMRLPKEKAHVESMEILLKLKEMYPGLKPDCWKYYSDVAGKQKRQFGVDRESLEVIKSPDFDPVFEGEKLSFRIIDRQKRDVSFEESNKDRAPESDNQWKELFKKMYVPLNPEITNAPLTRIRTSHYSDLIADDLKLYVGPSNYPEARVDDVLFRTIKRSLEDIVFELPEEQIPKFHDMYLFDGVIFIICQDKASRQWLEQNLVTVNKKLHTNLKATEFRGAVGIISMVVKTDKDTDEVIDLLQKQNPRLRTKYWRKISTVRTKTKLDAVLQIDKLSAQVITSQSFNKYIDSSVVEFKLGHLQSLMKPKSSLEELTKTYAKKQSKEKVLNENDGFKTHWTEDQVIDKVTSCEETYLMDKCDIDPVIIDKESPKSNETVLPDKQTCKVFLKIPMNILPETEDDLNIIFDLLEDKNPGLNTELWEVYTDGAYPSNGRFTIIMDKQSISVINGKQFDSTIGGERLKFLF